jgi:hypothetical protein
MVTYYSGPRRNDADWCLCGGSAPEFFMTRCLCSRHRVMKKYGTDDGHILLGHLHPPRWRPGSQEET